MSKAGSFFYVVILSVLANTGGILLFDGMPVRHREKAEYTAAVIAIRDKVPLFQRKLTRFFTLPKLKRKYNDVVYLEAADNRQLRSDFRSAVTGFALRVDSIDIFLLAHSNQYVECLTDIPEPIAKKIRLVYNSGCANADQRGQWKSHHVKYYLAHSGKNSLSPVFYFYFLRHWVNGTDLQEAVVRANRSARRVLKIAGRSGVQAEESLAALFRFYE